MVIIVKLPASVSRC